MHDVKEAVTDPRALKTIMLSLQRLMKIGVYYPFGHTSFERVVGYFKQHLARVAGENPYIRFSVKDNHLYLQDIQLDTSMPFVQEFKETLAGMAIRHLDIDKDILPIEIQSFIRNLLVYRAKYNSAKSFVHIDIKDLPLTVRFSQLEYLSSEVQAERRQEVDDPGQQTIEVFLESLIRGGLTGNELDLCRELLENVLHHPGLAVTDYKHLPTITWSDIERLLLDLVGKKEQSHDQASAKSQQNVNALTSILNSLGERTADESSSSAIDLLISMVKKPACEIAIAKESEGLKAAGDGQSNLLDVADITHFVQERRTPRILQEYLRSPHRCEVLTIALQMLLQTLPLQAKYRLQQILREVLTGPILDMEWKTLVDGVHTLLKCEKSDTLDVSLLMILSPLRRSEFSSPLYLLEQVSHKCMPIELTRLLPYIINELLVTDKQAHSEVFQDLCEMLLYLPTSDIRSTIPVLEKLDALAEENVVQSLFFALPARYYPIFAPLLYSSAGVLMARRAYHAFSNNSHEWLIDAMLPILDCGNMLHVKFLYEYLSMGALSQPTTRVKTLAGRIVVEKLPTLHDDKRRELAIMRTIRAMPQLKAPNIRQVLESIATKRYLLVIPDWPLNCRKVAREALLTLDRVERPMH